MPRTVQKRDFPPIDAMAEGQLLQAARITAKISQTTLCDLTNVPKATLSFWENSGKVQDKYKLAGAVIALTDNGKSSDNPYLSKLQKICEPEIKAMRFLTADAVDTILSGPTEGPNVDYFLAEAIRLLSSEGKETLMHQCIALLKRDKEAKDKWFAQYGSMPSQERAQQADAFRTMSAWVNDYNDFVRKYVASAGD